MLGDYFLRGNHHHILNIDILEMCLTTLLSIGEMKATVAVMYKKLVKTISRVNWMLSQKMWTCPSVKKLLHPLSIREGGSQLVDEYFF